MLLAIPSLHISSGALAGSNGSVDTVSDCSHVNDNQFYVGDTVKGKGSNFDDNANYEWTITKTDSPSQGTQVANGSFNLGNNVSSFCITLWTAYIVGGDTHSEFTWEVDEETTDKKGNISWKKIDSDNFYVDPAQVIPTATPTPTTAPTPTPTPTMAPTATPTPTKDCDGDTDDSNANDKDCQNATPTPTIAPTATPTPTVAPTPSSNNNGDGSNTGDGRSDGLSSCPQCTQTPQTSGQAILGASTQAVLGASTMAGTGTFEQNLMNTFAVLGALLMSAAGILYKRETNKILA